MFKPRSISVVLALLLAQVFFAPISHAAKKVASIDETSVIGTSRTTTTTSPLTSAKIPAVPTSIMVLGDSLGNGVWAGLYHAFRKNKNIKVMKKSKPSTGFVRLDFYDWNANLKKILATTKIDVAVVMVGANDRQTIVTKAGRYKPGSKRWREIYASRVDEFILKLKTHGAKVYWVGLPITRRKKYTNHMKILNEIFAARARANNIVFVDIWKDFVSTKGRYSAHGKDITGRVRKLRANDGVHFTMRGYRKLAFATEHFIRADFAKKPQPLVVVKMAEKTIIPKSKLKPKKVETVLNSPVVVPDPKPANKTPSQDVKSAIIAHASLMMGPETVGEDAVLHQPQSNKIATLEIPAPQIIKTAPVVDVRSKVSETPIVTSALPKFKANADYLAKNLQKTEKTDVGGTIRQALANDFQGILSIVQPDKAVVLISKATDVPVLRGPKSDTIVLLMRKTETLSLNSDLLRRKEIKKVAPHEVGNIRPVSIESGTPDGNVEYAEKVEYASKTPDTQDAFTGTSARSSIASISGLGFSTLSDSEGILTTIVYRTLLRGDAVSPKAGRGDDFSWPRD